MYRSFSVAMTAALRRRAHAPAERPHVAYSAALDRAARESEVKDLDFRLLYLLELWLREHPGIFPEKGQLARVLARSVDTIARALGRLEARGEIVVDGVGNGRRVSRVVFQLGSPRPQLARQPSTSIQGELFPAEESPHPCGLKAATAPDKGRTGAAYQPSNPPPIPPLILFEEKRLTDSVGENSSVSQSVFSSLDREEQEPTEEELIQDLIRRCLEETAHCEPFKQATERRVRDAIANYGTELLEFAIDRRIEQSTVIYSWGWYLGTMEKARRQCVNIAKIEETAAKRTEPVKAAEPVEAPMSDVEIEEAVRAAGAPGNAGRLATLGLQEEVRRGRLSPDRVPQEILERKWEPAAGRVAKLPPPPVGAPSPLVPSHDYTVATCPRQNPLRKEGPGHAPGRIRTCNLRIRSPQFRPSDQAAVNAGHVSEKRDGSIDTTACRDSPTFDAKATAQVGILDRAADIRSATLSPGADLPAVNVDRFKPREITP
jgi:hypothetical protein